MKKEKTIIIKKKVNPIATDANYERVVEVIGRANTALLADEMKAKKFSFGSANKRSQKKMQLVPKKTLGMSYVQLS